LDENKNKRPNNFRGGNAKYGHTGISDDGGEDSDGPEFLMYAFLIMKKRVLWLWIIMYVSSKTSKKKQLSLRTRTKKKCYIL
jgi:hypothetical protein